MNKYKPYGTNILVKPASKNKVIGDTSKFYLFGEVLGVGEKVGTFRFLLWNFKRKDAIKVGDTIGYTLWGLNKIIEADGTEHFFVQDNPDFILGVMKNDN